METVREDYEAAWRPDGQIEILPQRPGRFTVYWSSSPVGFTDDNEVGSFEGTAVVGNPLAPRRCYYHIFSGHGYSVAVPRALIAEGAANLRDIGGYNTADGSAFVRYGALFRSGALARLTTEQREFAAELGLRQIVDLRLTQEITPEDADPVFAGAEYAHLSPLKLNDISRYIHTCDDFLGMSAEQAMECYRSIFDAYSMMPFGNEALRGLFALILNGRLPLVYHCVGGKDRTGVATALILLALGVPRETIVYDYMLTGTLRAHTVERRIEEYRQKGGADEGVVAAMRAFLGVSLEAIGSMFSAIDAAYSDIEEFFEKELLVPASDMQRLRDMLLIKHKESK